MELAQPGRVPDDRAQLGLDAGPRRPRTTRSSNGSARRSTPPVGSGSGRSSRSTRSPATRRCRPRDRVEFGSYAAAILRGIPELEMISLGNEPNSNTFWMPQFGRDGTDAAAAAYFRLLETAYPLVKAASPHVHGDRRLAGRPRRGQPARLSADALADQVHRGSRRRLPRERAPQAPVRPLLDPPVSRRTPRSRRPRATRTRPRSGSPTTRSS